MSVSTEEITYRAEYSVWYGKEWLPNSIVFDSPDDCGGQAQRFATMLTENGNSAKDWLAHEHPGAIDVRLDEVKQVTVTERPCALNEDGWLKIEETPTFLMGNDHVDEERLPVELGKIRFTKLKPAHKSWLSDFEEGRKMGALVAVRPVPDNPDKKTYVGIYVCDVPIDMVAYYDKETGTLDVRDSPANPNPMILVPALGKVVMGYESWWGPIKDEEHLRQITDEDIQNIPYVKMLKILSEEKAETA
jgi:hypothetical protein